MSKTIQSPLENSSTQAIWINVFCCKNFMHIFSYKCLFFTQLHNTNEKKTSQITQLKWKWNSCRPSTVLYCVLGPYIRALHHKLFNLKPNKKKMFSIWKTHLLFTAFLYFQYLRYDTKSSWLCLLYFTLKVKVCFDGTSIMAFKPFSFEISIFLLLFLGTLNEINVAEFLFPHFCWYFPFAFCGFWLLKKFSVLVFLQLLRLPPLFLRIELYSGALPKRLLFVIVFVDIPDCLCTLFKYKYHQKWQLLSVCMVSE